MKKQNFIQKREVQLSCRIRLLLALPKEANEIGETPPPATQPRRTPLGLACVGSFISEETKRGVWPHCLSQTLHSPLASMSACVCVCVCMHKCGCVCVCVFDALTMLRSLACLVTIPTSLPVFLRVKAPFLSRFLLQLLGRRPVLLPARRHPPSRLQPVPSSSGLCPLQRLPTD